MLRLAPWLLALTLLSCRKERRTIETVNGIVLHNLTNLPVANQRVTVYITTFTLGEKDPPDFPDGRPIYSNKWISMLTDADGKFSLGFDVTGEWIFTARVVEGSHAQVRPLRNLAIPFPANPSAVSMARAAFDTIFVERSAIIRYQIQNIDPQFTNDTLWIQTHYANQRIRDWNQVVGGIGDPYNIALIGESVNRVIADTVPAESLLQVPIHWKHTRQGVIQTISETIPVAAGTVTTYPIQY